jgi:hypothetical protein
MFRRAVLSALLAFALPLAGCAVAPDPAETVASGGGERATDTEREASADTAPTSTPDELVAADAVADDATPNAARVRPASAEGSASATGDCPALLYLDAVDPPADARVISYGNLPDERRNEFDRALVEGHAELEDGGEGYRFWANRPYVEHDGTVYRAVVAVC